MDANEAIKLDNEVQTTISKLSSSELVIFEKGVEYGKRLGVLNGYDAAVLDIDNKLLSNRVKVYLTMALILGVIIGKLASYLQWF